MSKLYIPRKIKRGRNHKEFLLLSEDDRLEDMEREALKWSKLGEILIKIYQYKVYNKKTHDIQTEKLYKFYTIYQMYFIKQKSQEYFLSNKWLKPQLDLIQVIIGKDNFKTIINLMNEKVDKRDNKRAKKRELGPHQVRERFYKLVKLAVNKYPEYFFKYLFNEFILDINKYKQQFPEELSQEYIYKQILPNIPSEIAETPNINFLSGNEKEEAIKKEEKKFKNLENIIVQICKYQAFNKETRNLKINKIYQFYILLITHFIKSESNEFFLSNDWLDEEFEVIEKIVNRDAQLNRVIEPYNYNNLKEKLGKYDPSKKQQAIEYFYKLVKLAINQYPNKFCTYLYKQVSYKDDKTIWDLYN